MSVNIPVVDLIRTAYRQAWAVGQFNMSNLETLQAIVAAASEARSPVMVGVSMGTLRHVGLSYVRGLLQAAKYEAEREGVPLFFHLDHGPNLEIIQSCIGIGFDSVMIDTSQLSFEDNVTQVRRVVEVAHAAGVGVEAQIGETWDEETGEHNQALTDPAQVGRFVELTGVDYLAFSFGNTPGRVEGNAEVDLELVRNVGRASPVPIVIHGGTSVPDAAVKIAIQAGVAKINIDTAIRKAVTHTLREIYGNPAPPSDPRIAMKQAREAAMHAIMQKMALFGSAGKAPLIQAAAQGWSASRAPIA